MWSIALLINTSTWSEVVHNWELICLVFMELHLGNESIDRQHHDALLDKISKIEGDPNASTIINSIDDESIETANNQDPFEYDDSEDDLEQNEYLATSQKRTIRNATKDTRVSVFIGFLAFCFREGDYQSFAYSGINQFLQIHVLDSTVIQMFIIPYFIHVWQALCLSVPDIEKEAYNS